MAASDDVPWGAWYGRTMDGGYVGAKEPNEETTYVIY
jgi:hypothetical protein